MNRHAHRPTPRTSSRRLNASAWGSTSFSANARTTFRSCWCSSVGLNGSCLVRPAVLSVAGCEEEARRWVVWFDWCDGCGRWLVNQAAQQWGWIDLGGEEGG